MDFTNSVNIQAIPAELAGPPAWVYARADEAAADAAENAADMRA